MLAVTDRYQKSSWCSLTLIFPLFYLAAISCCRSATDFGACKHHCNEVMFKLHTISFILPGGTLKFYDFERERYSMNLKVVHFIYPSPSKRRVRNFALLWVRTYSHVYKFILDRRQIGFKCLSTNICVCCCDSLMSVGVRNRRKFTLWEAPWSPGLLSRTFGKENVTLIRCVCANTLLLVQMSQHNNYVQVTRRNGRDRKRIRRPKH